MKTYQIIALTYLISTTAYSSQNLITPQLNGPYNAFSSRDNVPTQDPLPTTLKESDSHQYLLGTTGYKYLLRFNTKPVVDTNWDIPNLRPAWNYNTYLNRINNSIEPETGINWLELGNHYLRAGDGYGYVNSRFLNIVNKYRSESLYNTGNTLEKLRYNNKLELMAMQEYALMRINRWYPMTNIKIIRRKVAKVWSSSWSESQVVYTATNAAGKDIQFMIHADTDQEDTTYYVASIIWDPDYKNTKNEDLKGNIKNLNNNIFKNYNKFVKIQVDFKNEGNQGTIIFNE